MPQPEDCAMLTAYFDGVDHVRAEHEAKWGSGRLPLLVAADLRARFYRQLAIWSVAYAAAWAAPILTRGLLEAVQTKAAAVTRAWAALDAAAAEAGHRPIAPWVWEVALADGTVAALVQTDAEASKVIAEGRHVAVYTLAEVGHVIDALPEALKLAKVEWPGAKVQPPRGKREPAPNDEIPF